MSPAAVDLIEADFKNTAPSEQSVDWVPPDSRFPDDRGEHTAVSNEIVALWGEMKNGKVKNKEDFELWVGRTSDVLVSCTSNGPTVWSPRSSIRDGTVDCGRDTRS